MAIINTLENYVTENRDELLVKASLGTKTLGIVAIYPNVKSKTALNYLDSQVVLDDGSKCGFEAKGSDTLSDRFIEVATVKVNKAWCDKDLKATYANHQILFEAGMEQMPFENKFVEANQNATKDALEKAIWNGDATSHIAGWIPTLKKEEDVIKPQELSAGATAEDVINAAYDNLTELALSAEPVIFVSNTTFVGYVKALNACGKANAPIYDAAAGELQFPGDTRVRIIAVPGLAGFKGAVAGPAKNLIYATDILDSENVYKVYYDENSEEFRFKVLFNAGTQVLFPDQEVLVTVGA